MARVMEASPVEGLLVILFVVVVEIQTAAVKFARSLSISIPVIAVRVMLTATT
jgi:hypothetical protein